MGSRGVSSPAACGERIYRDQLAATPVAVVDRPSSRHRICRLPPSPSRAIRLDPRLPQPSREVVGVESDVMAQSVMRNRSGASLREQPCVWDAEERARGLRVDERCERAAPVGNDAAVGLVVMVAGSWVSLQVDRRGCPVPDRSGPGCPGPSPWIACPGTPGAFAPCPAVGDHCEGLHCVDPFSWSYVDSTRSALPTWVPNSGPVMVLSREGRKAPP